jgi:hypothetical protein
MDRPQNTEVLRRRAFAAKARRDAASARTEEAREERVMRRIEREERNNAARGMRHNEWQ